MDAAVQTYQDEMVTVVEAAFVNNIGATTLQRELKKRGIPAPFRVPKICVYCNSKYLATGAKQEACLDPDCQQHILQRRRAGKTAYNRRHLANHKRRARLREASRIEDVDRLTVAERGDWICGLCHKSIDLTATLRLEDGSYNPEYLHIDHIVSLSNGGDHTYENCQPSHAWCNWSKNNTD
jgi:5-methylcytosine-specific restriction endonuclease McrA